MKKNKNVIYYITVISEAYASGDGLCKLKDEQGDETNINFYTGFYSKKKSKKFFETIAQCSSYDNFTVSIEKHEKLNADEWIRNVVCEITLQNEEQDRKNIKRILREVEW